MKCFLTVCNHLKHVISAANIYLYSNILYIVTFSNIMILYKNKSLLIVYLVIRNTELLPELDFMSCS